MPKLIERIRAAAFDLDGTLIDTAPDLATAVNVMLTMLGSKALPEPRVRALIGNGVDHLVLQALAESLDGRPTHAAQRSAALSLFRRLYAQRLFERGHVYPGVMRALRSLSEAGITLCCVTNKDDIFALPLLEAARLGEFFAFTVCPGRPQDRKPSPNMLLAACSRLGIAPAEMLYVGDSRADIVAARAAGCRVVAVNYGYHRDQPLDEVRPDGIIASMTDLVTLYVRSLFARVSQGLCLAGGRT